MQSRLGSPLHLALLAGSSGDLRPAPALVTGIIAGPVALAAGATPPEWIKVTPRGPATTRDGRTYTFDPAVLAARFRADGVDLPVDTDHSTILLGAQGLRPNTIGHAGEIEARQDGTYARVDWLDGGKAVLAARTHRYVSPTLHHDAAGNVTWLHSIALVSVPALGGMPALAHAQPEPPRMQQIAKALGLADGADEAACLAAIAALRQAGGSSALVAELQSQLAATGTRLQAVEKSARDKEIEALIGDALKARKIVPAQRDTYVLMCATDAGLQGVRALLAATPAGLQPSGLDARAVETGDDAVDPVSLAAQGQALMAERRAAGQVIGIAEAIAIISKRAKG